MLIIGRYGHPVLFPDSTEAGQLRVEILTDLDGRRDQHGAETGWIVDKQLRPRIPATMMLRGSARNASIFSVDAIPSRYRDRRSDHWTH